MWAVRLRRQHSLLQKSCQKLARLLGSVSVASASQSTSLQEPHQQPPEKLLREIQGQCKSDFNDERVREKASLRIHDAQKMTTLIVAQRTGICGRELRRGNERYTSPHDAFCDQRIQPEYAAALAKSDLYVYEVDETFVYSVRTLLSVFLIGRAIVRLPFK